MRGFLASVIAVALAACAQQTAGEPIRSSIPEGAIKTGADLYMVPLSLRDSDGCQGYRQYSPIHMVTMAIYYRDRTGGFTANKLQADCYAKD